jgi:hypothetical protein
MQINAAPGRIRLTVSTMPRLPEDPPMRLFFLLYSLVATVLSGTGSSSCWWRVCRDGSRSSRRWRLALWPRRRDWLAVRKISTL